MLPAILQCGSGRATREVIGERTRDERFPLRRRHVPARQPAGRIADLQNVLAAGDVAQEAAAHRFGGRRDELDEDRGALILRPQCRAQRRSQPIRQCGVEGRRCHGRQEETGSRADVQVPGDLNAHM